MGKQPDWLDYMARGVYILLASVGVAAALVSLPVWGPLLLLGWLTHRLGWQIEPAPPDPPGAWG